MLLGMQGSSIVLHILTAILSAVRGSTVCLLYSLTALLLRGAFMSLSVLVHSQLVGCMKPQSNLMNCVSMSDIGLNTRLHAVLPCIALHTGMT